MVKAKYTEEMINRIYTETSSDDWEYENLRWLIINSFEELGEFKESLPLQKWINKYLENKIIDIDTFTLISKIAFIFNEYFIYRPEIIKHWDQCEIDSQKLDKINLGAGSTGIVNQNGGK